MPSPTSPHPGSSRDKIIDVAEALFARRGYSGVGLRELAGAAGLGKSSLFHHFRGKAQIYLAVLERVFGRLDERLSAALGAGGSPSQRLDRALGALIDGLAEHPTTARLLLRSLFEDDDLPDEVQHEAVSVDAALAGIVDRILGLLREGIDTGEFRQVSARHTLQTLIGSTVYHFASGEFGESLFGRPIFSAEAVQRRKSEVRALLYEGLAARPVA